jgi:hypothetical protein
MVTATALMVAIAMRPSTAAVRKDPVGSRSLRASDRVKLEAQQRIIDIYRQTFRAFISGLDLWVSLW